MSDLWDFLRGALMTSALAAVVDAGVPEAPADGPRPVAELPAGGRERDEQQWRALLEGADWEQVRFLGTGPIGARSA